MCINQDNCLSCKIVLFIFMVHFCKYFICSFKMEKTDFRLYSSNSLLNLEEID